MLITHNVNKLLKIDVLNTSHNQELVDFLDYLGQQNPSVLGYHYPIYRDMLAQIGVGEPYYLGAWSGDELVGLLPGFIKRTEFGLVYSSLPFFGPNAGVICGNNEQRHEVHNALLSSVLDYLNNQPAILSASFITPFIFDHFECYDRMKPDAIIVQKITQYLNLPLTKWDNSILYDLRKSKKMGVNISTDISNEKVTQFYNIYKQNCEDYGIPIKPRSSIDFLLYRGIPEGRVSCYFAFKDETMIAGLIVIWGPLTASYYLPCTLDSARSLQPGTALIEAAFSEAKNRGILFWNWEASPSRDSGVYKFKKKWGSQETNYRIYVLPFRDINYFRQIGREHLAEQFPYYFVYPYDKL
jgi:hypothetical protein